MTTEGEVELLAAASQRIPRNIPAATGGWEEVRKNSPLQGPGGAQPC